MKRPWTDALPYGSRRSPHSRRFAGTLRHRQGFPVVCFLFGCLNGTDRRLAPDAFAAIRRGTAMRLRYATLRTGKSQTNARQRFTDRFPAQGKRFGRKSFTFFRKPRSSVM